MTTITPQHFKAIAPRCKNITGFTNQLNLLLPAYEINTQERISAFLAQTSHECGGYTVFSENLNYSAKALNITFGKYFKRQGRDAEPYHRKPEKIANLVYSNRMGNGDVASGDGWRYRGRGIIQLTGKDNYINFGKAVGKDVVSNPDLITDSLTECVMTGIWFWERNNLNALADQQDMKAITKRINGGYNGLEHRLELYQTSMNQWGPAPIPLAPRR